MSEQGPRHRREGRTDRIGWTPMTTLGKRVLRAKDYDQAGITPEDYERNVLVDARGPEAKTVATAITEVISLTRPDGSPSVILDVAAGTGLLSRELAAAGYQVVATDLSQRYLDYLTEQAPDITTVQGDMNIGLPIADQSVDGVTILGSNRFITDIPHFIDESKRVLRPGGILVWPIVERDDRLWRKNIGDRKAPTKPDQLAEALLDHGFSASRVVHRQYSKTGHDVPGMFDRSIHFVLGRVPTNTV